MLFLNQPTIPLLVYRALIQQPVDKEEESSLTSIVVCGEVLLRSSYYLCALDVTVFQTYVSYTGAATLHSSDLQRSQFDEEFIEALKGHSPISLCPHYLHRCFQPQSTIPTLSIFTYLFHQQPTVSYPGRSYYGGPTQECCNCRDAF